MTSNVRMWLTTICILCFSAHAVARLGETESELIARFGTPTGRSSHSIFAQGKRIDMGPVIVFRQDEWSISCDLVDGKCMRISYSKPGDWSEDQIRLVLNTNTKERVGPKLRNHRSPGCNALGSGSTAALPHGSWEAGCRLFGTPTT